jgi:hypothetical protein
MLHLSPKSHTHFLYPDLVFSGFYFLFFFQPTLSLSGSCSSLFPTSDCISGFGESTVLASARTTGSRPAGQDLVVPQLEQPDPCRLGGEGLERVVRVDVGGSGGKRGKNKNKKKGKNSDMTLGCRDLGAKSWV